MILKQKWSEPESGAALYLLDLPETLPDEIKADIAWLKLNAADEYGGALSKWVLSSKLAVSSPGNWEQGAVRGKRSQNTAVYRDLASVRKMMVLESRYEEDPSFYGLAPYPPYAAIAGPSHWHH